MKETRPVAILTALSFFVGTAQFVVTGILDQMASSVGVSVAAMGQLITVYAFSSAVGVPLFMVAAARLDRKLHLLIGLALVAVGLLGMGLVPSFVALLVFRGVVGIGQGVFSVSAYAIVAQLAPQGRQASLMANLSMGYSASLIIGVPLGRVVAAGLGWPSIFLADGLLALAGLAAVRLWIPSTRGSAPIPLKTQLSYLGNPRVLVSLLATFAIFVSYSAGNTYVTPVLHLVSPGDLTEISLILMALGICSVVGSKMGGMISDKVGLAPMIVGAMLVQAGSVALVLPTSGWGILPVSLLFLWAAAAWACGPNLNLNLIRIGPQAAGILLSLNSSFVQLGFAVGAVLGGVAVGAGGSVSLILWLSAGTAVLAAVLIGSTFRMKSTSGVESH